MKQTPQTFFFFRFLMLVVPFFCLFSCQKEACEEEGYSMVVFWNKTGKSVTEYVSCEMGGNVGPSLPINAKSKRMGTPGAKESYCFMTSTGNKTISVTFPAVCEEKTYEIQ